MRRSSLLLCAGILCAPISRAQSQKEDEKEETFEKVDPYTHAKSAAMDRAGYVSFGPMLLAEGIKTGDVEELLGTRVLWVETAHFRLGSTLKTYKLQGDPREEKKLKGELDHLALRLPHFKAPQGKLDPWLRLHLYAQRLEEEYADFLARFGFRDADFAGTKASTEIAKNDYMGEGPFLGQEMKFTVLITEKSSHLARFLNHWFHDEAQTTYRGMLPGGSVFVGTSAESWRKGEYPLDATMHSAIANRIVFNFLDGFRKSGSVAPLWLKQGLAYYCSRRIDERWNVDAPTAARESTTKEDAWRWEPRVHGLVENRFTTPWKTMLGWQKQDELKAQDHMVVWSRVSWLLEQKDANLRGFLMGVTESLGGVDEKDRAKVSLDRQVKALEVGFGKSPEALDEAWKKFVLRTYPKN